MALLTGVLAPATGLAHAFPVKSVPRVGATVSAAPNAVRIWFDGELNALFSKVTVRNAAGRVVSKGHGHVSEKDPRLLEVRLKRLAPGRYWVRWRVVARDGHHTEGRYPFTVT
ncbi:MAG TPA: copper resistance CopC family protein [Gammaproteobacteria bacterium]|nr:copper resistance CopC family protein [Gammaproteobacteria bacterium]